MTGIDSVELDGVLTAWVEAHLGFDKRALRLERLRSAAKSEAARMGWSAFEKALVNGDAQLDAALIGAATVGETYFFRQREHFDLLTQLPFKGTEKNPLLVWSAACASGEEAYSMTLALRQLGLESPALKVWGTDINQSALDSAKAANYGKWSFRASTLSAGANDSTTEAAQAEILRAQVLDPKTRACVTFARHNLLDAPSFDGRQGPRFHLIFCRNALVYFQPEAARIALEHLAQALVPGGWLVLGNMDIAHSPAGMRRVGTAHLCVFERVALSDPIQVAKAPLNPATITRPRPKVVAASKVDLDPEEAIDWHRGVMAQLEAGEDGAAILELQALIEAFPTYLPGWFEHGLTLNRRGQKLLATHSLKQVLELARHIDPSKPVPGPESLTLDFYVGNAEAFLQSQGDSLQ